MIWYLFLAAFPAVFGLLLSGSARIQRDEKIKKHFIIICGIVIFLMIALRKYSVGSNDSETYYNNWRLLSTLDGSQLSSYLASQPMETGYLAIVWALSHIFHSPQILFVLSGLLFTISVCRFIYLNSKDPIMSLTMFITLGLYSFMVQGLRQAIAMSICLFAIEFCKKRKLWLFLMLVCLAAVFHRSAIVFIILYPLYQKKNNELFSFGVFICCGVALFLSNTFVWLGNIVFDRSYKNIAESGGYIAVAICVLILGFSFLSRKKKQETPEWYFFMYMTILELCLYLMRYFSAQVFERISFYFAFGQLILLPDAVERLEAMSRFLSKLFITIACIALLWYRCRGSNLVPYVFFWQ